MRTRAQAHAGGFILPHISFSFVKCIPTSSLRTYVYSRVEIRPVEDKKLDSPICSFSSGTVSVMKTQRFRLQTPHPGVFVILSFKDS